MKGFGLSTTSRSSRDRRSGVRKAFTLVELLVVIVIIGILIALLIPTIGSAMLRAKNARISIEISELARAVEAYRMEMSAYPPDFANPTMRSPNDAQQMTTHLARKFRHRNPQDQSTLNIEGLDPAEALVFWLSGFSSDVKFPLAKREAFDVGGRPLKGDKAFFQFDQGRLLDKDGDGYPEYYPPGNIEKPYVYIRNDSYGIKNTNELFTAYTVTALKSANSTGFPVTAYVAELSGTNIKRFVDAEKYQIICSGQDGEYGVGTPVVYPDGIGYSEDHEDNLTSFSEGKTLQDAIP